MCNLDQGFGPLPNRQSVEIRGAVFRHHVAHVAVLNQAALGRADTVIVELRLENHDDEALQQFEAMLTKFLEVVEAYLVTGEYDCYIKVAVAGTAGYEAFLREKLYKLPGTRQTRTSFALRCLKQTTQPAVSKR